MTDGKVGVKGSKGRLVLLCNGILARYDNET